MCTYINLCECINRKSKGTTEKYAGKQRCNQMSPVSLLLDKNVEMLMIIMMRDIEQLKCNNERWYSPVFCTATHEKGYHFNKVESIDANGWCGTGDAIAVVASIVK